MSKDLIRATIGLGAMLLEAIALSGSANTIPSNVPAITICIVSIADSRRVGADEISGG
jgi:hypothetical protein